ncbi:DUF5714 domain-containing protein [Chloroflexota bacterium]
MASKDNCGICGKPLVYQTDLISMTCVFCEQEYTANIYCPGGHYICDSCHEQEALGILRQIVSSSTSKTPAEILEVVMSHPSVPMHGPEHHAMVPAVIIAAVKNAGYSVPNRAIDEAVGRGARVPGGWCGFFGACGAAIGVGIAVSLLGAATPMTGKPRSLAMEATSYVLSRMVDGYLRCCKRASRMALEAAVKFLQDRMGIVLGKGETISCAYSGRNLECPRDGCPYYDG